MAGMLSLYTDASIRGRLLPPPSKPNRTRVGPAFAAWAGWHDSDHAERPTLAGQTYIGTHGTQTAEFMAVIHGLGAVLGHYEPRRESVRPAELKLHVDNRCVYMLMVGEWTAKDLAPFFRVATSLTARLFGMGIEVGVVKVPETDTTHKVVHTMSKNAHKQVLAREEWRPSDDRPEPVRKPAPPPPAVAAWDDDIPF
jgi:ribonuclease HI